MTSLSIEGGKYQPYVKHETVILRKHFLTSLKQLTFHNTIFHIQTMEKQKKIIKANYGQLHFQISKMHL